MRGNMKRYLAALFAVCLLLTGCQNAAQKAPEAPEPASAPDTQTTPEPTSASEAPEEEDDKAMYQAYLDILTENREAILGYDWQKGMIFDEGIYETRPAGTTEPIVFADVWGDEAPELLYAASVDSEGHRYFARLHIVTFENGEARELGGDLSLSLDEQVGGGENYRLFQTGEDKGLWIYRAYYSEGCDEEYVHLTAEGEIEAQFTCSHSEYPIENDAGEWVTVGEWKKLGAACSQESYESAVPSQEEQAKGILMRNAEYYEYSDDAEAPEDYYLYPQGTAMTYDAAVAYLRGELGIALDETVDEKLFFASLPRNFSFLSGAGGWSSELYLSSDGTFTGGYHDSDMGDDGEGYPDGTLYVCSFSGRFGDVKRVDDYTYSMHLLEMNVEETPAEEWIEDGVRYVSSVPYGLENADEILVYLPGAWLRNLPDEFVSWVSMPHAWGWDERPVLLPFYGLYNVADEKGWSSGEEVSVKWADDALGAYGQYDSFTAETGDPQAKVLFVANNTVKQFKVLALSVEDITEDGEMVFSSRELYTLDELTPGQPLLVETVFHGDSPSLGFSYVDGYGNECRFAVDVSGMDGSLISWLY